MFCNFLKCIGYVLVFIINTGVNHGFTPPYNYVRSVFDGLEKLIEDGDDTKISSFFTDDVRYCGAVPSCVKGINNVKLQVWERFKFLTEVAKYELQDLTLDDGFFLVNANVFAQQGKCSDIFEGANLAFINENGLIYEWYSVAKPTREEFNQQVGVVKQQLCK